MCLRYLAGSQFFFYIPTLETEEYYSLFRQSSFSDSIFHLHISCNTSIMLDFFFALEIKNLKSVTISHNLISSPQNRFLLCKAAHSLLWLDDYESPLNFLWNAHMESFLIVWNTPQTHVQCVIPP